MHAEDVLPKAEIFSGIDEARLRALAAASELRLIESGEILVRAGADHTAVVLLTSGKLSLYRRNPQADVTLLLGVLDAEALFGDAEQAAGVSWMCSVRANEDSICVLIPNDSFQALVEEHPILAVRLYRDACIRHLLANYTAQTMALYDVETRLLRLLLDYAYRFGGRRGDDAVIERPISKVEIAAALGVNRKTITRVLMPLEERGVISRNEEGHTIVHDLAELERTLPRDLLGLSSSLGETVQPVLRRWQKKTSPDR